jgi:hypothetical protein
MMRKIRSMAEKLAFFGSLAAALACALAADARQVPDRRPGPASNAGARSKKSVAEASARNSSRPAVRPGAPADVDAEVPPVKPGVSCALPEVLQAAGERVREFAANMDRFTATEHIEHSELDKNGNSRPPARRSYQYLVSISEVRPGMLNVEETRNGNASLDDFPTRLATRGLAAFALVFHPYFAGDFEMACEGLGEWRGQPAWQVHFRQRPDQPPRIREYRVGGRVVPVELKGRAWIADKTFQVLRLETDLAKPIPAIRLENEHLTIEYRPVPFPKRNVELWLPESAELYMDFRGHGYHHRHSFSNFLLFSVDTGQQIQSPREP